MEVTFSSQPEHQLREQHRKGMVANWFLNFLPVSHPLTSYFILFNICNIHISPDRASFHVISSLIFLVSSSLGKSPHLVTRVV